MNVSVKVNVLADNPAASLQTASAVAVDLMEYLGRNPLPVPFLNFQVLARNQTNIVILEIRDGNTNNMVLSTDHLCLRGASDGIYKSNYSPHNKPTFIRRYIKRFFEGRIRYAMDKVDPQLSEKWVTEDAHACKIETHVDEIPAEEEAGYAVGDTVFPPKLPVYAINGYSGTSQDDVLWEVTPRKVLRICHDIHAGGTSVTLEGLVKEFPAYCFQKQI